MSNISSGIEKKEKIVFLKSLNLNLLNSDSDLDSSLSSSSQLLEFTSKKKVVATEDESPSFGLSEREGGGDHFRESLGGTLFEVEEL